MSKSNLIIAATLLFAGSAIFAEGTSYIGFSGGLHSNLGSLGRTMEKDGLESSVGTPGFDTSGNGTELIELKGDPQNLIPSANRLIAVSKSSRVIGVKSKATMTGLVLGAFYEKNWENTFLRLGVDYTQKIRGGTTTSTIAGGFKWLDIKWNYKNWGVPIVFGFKAKVGEKAAVYMGAGIWYFQGGWDVGGNNFGDIPTTIITRNRPGSLTVGAVTATDASTGAQRGGPMINEAVKFRVNGWGYTGLMGIEVSAKSKNKYFMEIEHKVGGKQGVAVAKSAGLARGFASVLAYPINLGGTVVKFGYKIAM